MAIIVIVAAPHRRGGMALFAMLAMGLGFIASPAEAAPFAYVTNSGDGTVSVIDTATNTVLTGPAFPIPVGSGGLGVAVTPDVPPMSRMGTPTMFR